MKNLIKSTIAGAFALGVAGTAMADTPGVSDDEIVIGSANDLSGIFAAIGVPSINGAKMRIEEANSAGGIHGRQIKFVVEDHGYQLPRASQALNKLVHRDGVFANILTLGTPHNVAGFQIMDPKGIFNVAALSGSHQMLMEPVDNKFLNFATYTDQALSGVGYLVDEKGADTVCAMYLPSDFGLEVSGATKELAEQRGITFGGETSHKPDEQDFVGALQKLKAAECDVISLALGVRQLITVVGTAKKIGWNDVTFFTTSTGFLDVVAAVPGGVTDGLYAASGFASLAARAEDEAPAKFIEGYKAIYGEEANGFAMIGYTSADLLIRGLEAAGPELTQDSFQSAMENLEFFDELLDVQVAFSPDNHLGVNEVVISVAEGGKWKTLSRQ